MNDRHQPQLPTSHTLKNIQDEANVIKLHHVLTSKLFIQKKKKVLEYPEYI